MSDSASTSRGCNITTSRARSREVLDESRMREIRTSGSMGGGLETESRQVLHGHEGGNPGDRQG